MHPQFTTKDIERFWSKVDASGDCWLWTAQVKQDGYGRFQWNERKRLAHRVVYEMLIGPIPIDRQIDHLCRVRSCVNPDHLQITTSRQNTLRGYSVCAKHSRATHCPQGHAYDATNTYTWQGKRHCRTCNRLRHRCRSLRTR